MSAASLERGLNAFKEQIDAPTATFFSACVHCGMCAEACLFFTETRDPKYTPIHKLEPGVYLLGQARTDTGPEQAAQRRGADRVGGPGL